MDSIVDDYNFMHINTIDIFVDQGKKYNEKETALLKESIENIGLINPIVVKIDTKDVKHKITLIHGFKRFYAMQSRMVILAITLEPGNKIKFMDSEVSLKRLNIIEDIRECRKLKFLMDDLKDLNKVVNLYKLNQRELRVKIKIGSMNDDLIELFIYGNPVWYGKKIYWSYKQISRVIKIYDLVSENEFAKVLEIFNEGIIDLKESDYIYLGLKAGYKITRLEQWFTKVKEGDFEKDTIDESLKNESRHDTLNPKIKKILSENIDLRKAFNQICIERDQYKKKYENGKIQAIIDQQDALDNFNLKALEVVTAIRYVFHDLYPYLTENQIIEVIPNLKLLAKRVIDAIKTTENDIIDIK